MQVGRSGEGGRETGEREEGREVDRQGKEGGSIAGREEERGTKIDRQGGRQEEGDRQGKEGVGISGRKDERGREVKRQVRREEGRQTGEK